MENLINWFEIPAADFNRAVTFYKSILSTDIQETEMFGTKMGFLPSDGTNVSGAVVAGDDQKPSMEGVTIYLKSLIKCVWSKYPFSYAREVRLVNCFCCSICKVA